MGILKAPPNAQCDYTNTHASKLISPLSSCEVWKIFGGRVGCFGSKQLLGLQFLWALRAAACFGVRQRHGVPGPVGPQPVPGGARGSAALPVGAEGAGDTARGDRGDRSGTPGKWLVSLVKQPPEWSLMTYSHGKSVVNMVIAHLPSTMPPLSTICPKLGDQNQNRPLHSAPCLGSAFGPKDAANKQGKQGKESSTPARKQSKTTFPTRMINKQAALKVCLQSPAKRQRWHEASLGEDFPSATSLLSPDYNHVGLNGNKHESNSLGKLASPFMGPICFARARHILHYVVVWAT